ncbi:MAG TPA: hypothetical protein DCO79_08870 [Spirochaeta sp.]|nr:hypothetical protein [Spirochaeta sp.]
MIRFLIKKSFFDAWDNLLSLILMNLGFIICIALMVMLPAAAGSGSAAISVTLLIPGLIISHLYAGAVSVLMYDVSDFCSANFRMLKAGFEKTWKASIILSAFNSIIAVVTTIALPFYLSMGSTLGFAGAVIIFWLIVFWLLSSQYFFPVLIRMDGNIRKSLKKSFLICLDNPFYSLFVAIQSVVILIISSVTVLLMPGISAVLLLHQDALKLRLYKYDWLEENPNSGKSKIPWDVLHKEDNEKLGHRSFKGMIFPWKD